ncbi:MAG: DeoR/GlpR family DNA-binding transcription regulator [Microbacterium sp.]|uniref:DeoR/GlpR family DNA-binding transcription regulator n=1 Tax=Microbacterium sp. TaxID=51671 RepID=UPI0039E57833
MAHVTKLDAERRREELAELARRPDGVAIEAAAELFAVSSMTIRRDLLELEAEGRVRRTRGGASAAPTARPFDARKATRATAKRAIAAKALALVPPSGTIVLDASSTISTLAAIVGPRDGLAAHTNGIETFQLLQRLDGVTAMLTGGAAEPTTGSLIGPLACQAARAVYADVFFASAAAIDPRDGSSEVSLAEAEVKQTMAANARRCVLCLDSSKLGARSVARALTPDDIAVLVTELPPDDPRLDPYRWIPTIL